MVTRKERAVAELGRLLPMRAEGTGLEPATGFPAPHFQCRR